jgi:hypothetical protein
MANTFKVKTKAGIGTSITTVYTVPSSTTTIVLGSLETLGGGKLVLQTTDILRVTSDTASSLDVALSIMEIT